MINYQQALTSQSLFAGKSWRLSPEPWILSQEQAKEVEVIGDASLAFYKAQELLYRKSAENKSILRNRDLKMPWVAQYLDRGKPEALIRYNRSKILKGSTPVVVRPDLLLTDDGFKLTELDSVPGGIGLTAFLNQLYGGEGRLGLSMSMVDAFYEALVALVPDKEDPMVLAIVSDESETYRPEFKWLAKELQGRGKRFYCCCPKDVEVKDERVFFEMNGKREQVDLVYRFFELFDLENEKSLWQLLEAEQAGRICITPPVKTIQEEKASLALFHHPELTRFWEEVLSTQHYRLLKKIIPKSWIVENVRDLPASAVLWAPEVNGQPIRDWRSLGCLKQKERHYILKASGFHELAWGARSVSLGSDLSQDDWLAVIEGALSQSESTLYVMQAFEKPKRVSHPVYKDENTVVDQDARLRLCPYYFVMNDGTQLGGMLATLCPADKKIIHGMEDAVLVPGGIGSVA